jgi:small subunit ribosomal protein S15
VSKRPPFWLKLSPEEVESQVIGLAKEGNPPSKIGVVLRDQYGVPLVKTASGKKVTQIMREAKLAMDLPEDLGNLLKKAARLKEHLKKNKKDYVNKRALGSVESKIRHLAKYYRKRGVLPKGWKYKSEGTIRT